MKTSQEKYDFWLNHAKIDQDTKAALLAMTDNTQITEAFHAELEFGTGGLRGIMGAGTNRMNFYTIRRASLGIANYILANAPDGACRGVVISYDSRQNSREFALAAAQIFMGCGIKAYVFKEMRPTPQLSFAIRELNCIAGVMITASHNPPEYNGYKAYW